MIKTSWGTKRTCTCGIRFYDLNKKEVECPGCGETINVERLSISALENSLRKKPHSEIVEKNKDLKAELENSSKSNLEVETDSDSISKTEIKEIIADKLKNKKKEV